MQIVIDIDDNLYTRLFENGDEYVADMRRACIAIRKGKPLPRGRGRLGDLDALEKEITNGIKAGNYEDGYEGYGHINNMDDCVDCVRYADTIIEAETESEDDADGEEETS